MYTYDLKIVPQSPGLEVMLTSMSAEGWECVTVWSGLVREDKKVSKVSGDLNSGVLQVEEPQVKSVFFVLLRQPTENPPAALLTDVVRRTVESCVGSLYGVECDEECSTQTEKYAAESLRTNAKDAMMALLKPVEAPHA